MNDPTITCPKCKATIKLTDAVAGPLLLQAEMEADKRVANAHTEMEAKLGAAQKAQAETTRKSRELDEAKRELDLTVEKQIQAGLEGVRIKAQHQAGVELSLKVREKEEQLSSMASKIESLKRQVEQGSQQAQGEALELELEAALIAKFPHDAFLPIPKGEQGADIVQAVKTSQGQPAGAIVWELKRTKSWSDGWLPKLREDQRRVTADIAVLVTQTLPKGVDTFDFIDGVWVVSIQAALPAAAMLRQGLFAAAASRTTSEGQLTKAEMVYVYLTGNGFRQRIQAIVEAFSTMQLDLLNERKAITKAWAKREKELDRVLTGTVGMYGDLQGIAGKTFQEIEGLKIEG